MNKYYGVQIVIDVVIIILSIFMYFNSMATGIEPYVIYNTLLCSYAVLEFLEFILSECQVREAALLSICSFVCAFSGFYLRNLDQYSVISISLLVWIVMIFIIKIIHFGSIYERRPRLFIVKLSCASFIIMIGVLVSINLYYKISNIIYMLLLLYLCYGVLELACDSLDYVSANMRISAKKE